jgi:hypothetical protein
MKHLQPLVTVLLCLAAGSGHTADSLELDGATITGNSELPKVLHIVPWKPPEPGELAGRPFNSLVNEILAPVDRDVIHREVEIYKAVHGFENGNP